jgi:hypothetical protein
LSGISGKRTSDFRCRTSDIRFQASPEAPASSRLRAPGSMNPEHDPARDAQLTSSSNPNHLRLVLMGRAPKPFRQDVLTSCRITALRSIERSRGISSSGNQREGGNGPDYCPLQDTQAFHLHHGTPNHPFQDTHTILSPWTVPRAVTTPGQELISEVHGCPETYMGNCHPLMECMGVSKYLIAMHGCPESNPSRIRAWVSRFRIEAIVLTRTGHPYISLFNTGHP